LLLRIISG